MARYITGSQNNSNIDSPEMVNELIEKFVQSLK